METLEYYNRGKITIEAFRGKVATVVWFGTHESLVWDPRKFFVGPMDMICEDLDLVWTNTFMLLEVTFNSRLEHMEVNYEDADTPWQNAFCFHSSFN